jgi:hypothetical protein
VATVLEIDHEDLVITDDRAVGLKSEVVDAAEGLFEDLRTHDGGADAKHDAAVELIDCAGEPTEVGGGGAAEDGAIEHGMVGDDVVTDAGVDGEGIS